MSKILVTAKVNPDLDGTACTLAYSDLLSRTGKEAEGFVFGTPQSEVRYFIDKLGIQFSIKEDTVSNIWDKYVLVDASSMKGMPKTIHPDQVIEVIDHRSGEPEKEFPKAKIQNDLIGAAATLIVERFIKIGLKPKIDHAKLLYGAIYHNTLNFIASNASQRDRAAASYLEDNFELSKNLISEMFNFSTFEILKDIKKALDMDKKDAVNGKNLIGAFQLIVWGENIFEQRNKVEEGINELSRNPNIVWSFLNLIDLENKISYIFSSSSEGKTILSSVLGCKFKGNWSQLNKIWLRKQIMPKIQGFSL